MQQDLLQSLEYKKKNSKDKKKRWNLEKRILRWIQFKGKRWWPTWMQCRDKKRERERETVYGWCNAMARVQKHTRTMTPHNTRKLTETNNKNQWLLFTFNNKNIKVLCVCVVVVDFSNIHYYCLFIVCGTIWFLLCFFTMVSQGILYG